MRSLLSLSLRIRLAGSLVADVSCLACAAYYAALQAEEGVQA